jgi:tetratricopeptide (TPR) repeat protein
MTEKYPDNYFFKYKLALAYAERKNFNEAEKTMAEVIKLIPTNPTFYLKLGEFMFKNGKYERVISVLKVALPLADDSLRPYFYFYIAKAYYALGDYKKSEKFLTYLSDSDYEVLKLKFYVYTALNEKKAAEKVLIVLKNNYKNEEVKHLEYLFNELFK